MKIYQQNYAVGKPYGNVNVINSGDDLEYREGTYTFKFGLVTFYCDPTFATFSFVYDGRMYSMTISDIKKPLTDRQLILRASKFAREVVLNCSAQ